ncbi:MAG: ABC transporter permease [Amphritea sp.]
MNLLYALQKLARALLTVLLIVTTVFVVLRLSGDPAIYVLGLDADPLALDAFRHRWGLDKPILAQYMQFLLNCLQGDFGYSYFEERDAIEAVMERLPATLLLMGITGLFTLLIGIPAGIYAALHRNTWIDRLTMLVSVAGFSLPNFVLGIFLIMLFSVTWQLLPTSGSGTWKHLVMPVLTMTVAEAAIFARFTRSAMLEVLNQPYMRTARAKGLRWHQAVYRHALPNAAIPLVTIVGFFVGTLVAGGVVTESLFAWPGLGRLLVSSVANRDLAVVQIIVMMIACSMVLTNLVIDLLYGWLDPRVGSLRTGD